MGIGKNIKVISVGDGYEVFENYIYYSKRHNRYPTIKAGMYSDGATSAYDIPDTDGWLIHDHICRYGKWDDGTLICNMDASNVLCDELALDGYSVRCHTWWLATFTAGGGAARKNGMWRVKKKLLEGVG